MRRWFLWALLAPFSLAQSRAESPLACDLKAFRGEERKRWEQLAVKLFISVEERRELPDGYAFRLAGSVSWAEAAAWSDMETKCCPFFDIQLERKRELGALWLQLRGRDGVKQFIREEFRF